MKKIANSVKRIASNGKNSKITQKTIKHNKRDEQKTKKKCVQKQ